MAPGQFSRGRGTPRRRGPDYFRRRARAIRDAEPCHICGGFIDPDVLHLDHVVELWQGGTESNGNLRAAHRSCNVIKSNHLRGQERREARQPRAWTRPQ